MANNINNLQIKKIFACLKQTGKDNEWLHDMLPEWTKKTSVRSLNSAEADTVIKNLVKSAAAPTVNYRFRTQKQFGKIITLKSKLDYSDDKLAGFVYHTTGTKHKLDELSVSDASAVINGLEKVLLLKQSQKFKVSNG